MPFAAIGFTDAKFAMLQESKKLEFSRKFNKHSLSCPSIYTKVDFRDGEASINQRPRALSCERILPLTLTWKDVEVEVELPGKKAPPCLKRNEVPQSKKILKGVSGVCRPGDLMAIMGASGAGKSTLMNTLTGRNIKNYKIGGDVRVNGWHLGKAIREVAAYVQQDDLFISTLSVREHLQFRALLRMDRRIPTQARLEKVEEVIKEMGLTKCANSRIGTIGGNEKGLSGGERKRLSFASEALTNPPIFFCDEPTSGLDTFMAQNIVQTLQDMVSRGHTVLCTIHQPSSELFSMFNRILLIAEGRTAFLGGQKDAMDYFESMGYPCPSNYNPADHYILTLAVVPGVEEESRRKTKAICDKFDESDHNSEIMAKITEMEEQANTVPNDPLIEEAAAGESRYTVPWFYMIRQLFWRAWVSLFRDLVLFRVRCGQTVVVGLVLSLVYLQIDTNQKGVQDFNGAMFLMVVNIAFTNIFSVLNSFPLELSVFMREYGSGLYRVDAYYLAKTLSEVPLFLVLGTLFSTICYWMIGLNSDWERYLIFVAIMLLNVNVAVSLGYFISTLCGSVNLSLAVAPPLMIPLMLFGGLFVNTDNIPIYFVWLEYLSWFKYAYEILMVNQWEGIDHIDCEFGDSVMMTSMNTTVTSQSRRCAYESGQDVLDLTSMRKDDVLLDILCMIALLIGLRILSFLALLIRSRRSKG